MIRNVGHVKGTSVDILLLLISWIAIVAAMFLSRSLLPIDETRYVSVAWEMWNSNHFLVPHLNGEAYSHKPPILFWLMHLGWFAFGVNEWWPRLLQAILSAVNLLLVGQLAKMLWPAEPRVAMGVMQIALSMLLWLTLSTMAMFDMLLTLSVLTGMISLIGLLRSQQWRFVAGLGVSIGFGLLTKGPVILLHLLPIALCLPWIERTKLEGSVRQWYARIAMGLVLGALIALAWAIPAGISGGEAYRDAIFWGQTAGRVVDSFAHKQPWWWYFPMLLVVTFPWLFYPALWKKLLALRISQADFGAKFCLVWIILVLLLLSAVSGKQEKYILPLMPAFALLFGHLLVLYRGELVASRRHVFLPTALFLALGLFLAVAPFLTIARYQDWLALLSFWWGIGFVLLLGLLFWLHWRSLLSGIQYLVTVSIVAFVVVNIGIVKPIYYAYYDLHAFSTLLKSLEDQGHPIANAGAYHGQYHFLGRLNHPIVVFDQGESWQQWSIDHPDGYVIIYYDEWDDQQLVKPVYFQRYRLDAVALWSAKQLQENIRSKWPFADSH